MAAVSGTSLRKSVYVASYFMPEVGTFVKEAFPSVNIIDIPSASGQITPDDARNIQENAEVIFCDAFLIKDFVFDCKKLKWVQLLNAGADPLLNRIDRENPPDFRMTRMAHNGIYIAEYVIMYILATEKNLMPMIELQTRRQWKQKAMCATRVISSLNICVLGVGAIGTEVARRCKQFGMTVTGVGKTAPGEKVVPPYFDHYTDNIQETLPDCDYLCSTVPSTPETRDLLSGQLLSVCQPNKTTLISVGRGDVIDEDTIVTAIKERWLRGAVLDVVPVEPLPDHSPLWCLDNVIITPHLSGYNPSPENMKLYTDEFVKNYELYYSGQKMNNEIDFKKGY